MWDNTGRGDWRPRIPQAPQVDRVDGRDNDSVACAHRVEGGAFDLALLLIEPRGLDVGLHFLERGHSARLDCVHEYEMPAIARLDRPAPSTGLELKQSIRERRAKFLGD